MVIFMYSLENIPYKCNSYADYSSFYFCDQQINPFFLYSFTVYLFISELNILLTVYSHDIFYFLEGNIIFFSA